MYVLSPDTFCLHIGGGFCAKPEILSVWCCYMTQQKLFCFSHRKQPNVHRNAKNFLYNCIELYMYIVCKFFFFFGRKFFFLVLYFVYICRKIRKSCCIICLFIIFQSLANKNVIYFIFLQDDSLYILCMLEVRGRKFQLLYSFSFLSRLKATLLYTFVWKVSPDYQSLRYPQATFNRNLFCQFG